MNSLKTVFARLNMDGTQDALATIGVAVKDVNGELRSATDIYTEVATKWDSMSRAQKTYISESLAGKYHITRMTALLDNWDTAMRAAETSQNSLGSSMEENRKHMQSLASAINKVQAAGQELAFTIGEGGLRDVMYSVLTSTATFIKGVTSLSDSATGTAIAITSLVASIAAFRIGATGAAATLPLLTAAWNAATGAVKGFTVALMRNPIGLLAVGLATAATAAISYLGAQKELTEEIIKLDQSAKQANDTLKSIEETLSSIGGTKKQDILDYDKTISNLELVKEKLDEVVKAEQEYINHAKDLDPNFSLHDVGIDPNNISQELKDLAQSAGINILKFNSLGEVIEAVNGKLNGMKETSKRLKENDLTSYLEENGQKIKLLNGLLEDQKNGLELNQGALSKLKELGIEYNSVLEEQNGKIGLNITNTNKLSHELSNAVSARIAQLERETAAEEKSLIAFLASMNIKISKIEEFGLVNGQLTSELNKQANAGNADALRFAGGAISRSAGAIQKAKDDLLEYKALFQSLKSEGQIGSGDTKKKTPSASSKSEYAPLTTEAKKLLEIENKLTEVQTKRQQLSPTSDDYRNNLQDEKNLLQEKISLLQKEYDLVTKTQRIGGKSNKVGGSTKDSDDALKRANELNQQIIKLQSDLSNLTFDQVNSSIEEYTEKNQYLDGQLKRVESTISSLSSTSQEYRDGLQEEVNILQLKQDNLHSEAELIRNQLANGRLTLAQQDQLKRKLQELGNEWLELNNNIKSKNIEVANSKFEQQNQIIDQLNANLEQSKARMSGLVEGSDDYNESLSQQNSLLIAMRSITEQQIASTLREIQVTDQKSARYFDLVKQLNGLRSAQIGYNNALKENQALRIQRINEQWDKDVAKEVKRAQELRDEILDSLKKLLNTKDLEFDSTSIKTKITSALNNLKNLNGEFVIDPKIKSIDSFEELESLINKYTKNLETVNKETEDLFKQGGTKSDLVDAIRDEAKYASNIKKDIKETNKLLEQKRLQYDQIEKSLEYQVSLIEKQRDKVISDLQNSLDVPIEIDWEKIKDDLVDLGQSGKIVIDDIVLDLDNATVVGDVSSDVGDITQDIVTDYKNITELNKKIEEQNTIFDKQEEIRAKISDLETKGKTDTKEYIKLKKELESLDKAALDARKKIQESIEKEVELLNDLRDEEKKIKEEIQERETVYKRQEELLKGQLDQVKKQIESTKNLYDEQIKAQKDKLDLLDEQIEREDRLIQRTKLLQELENARNDKRFEYVNEHGEIELTYDKGKVAELEQQLADFDKETQRNDQRKQIEDEIKRLEELRDKQITELESSIDDIESNLDKLKETHDKEIAQLNFYLNQNKALQDKLLSNINKHISDLETSFNKEIQYQNSRIEKLKAIHQAEIQAYEAFIAGLESQLDRLNDDIGAKIDDLAKRLDENIDSFAESAWDLGLLAKDIKKIAEQVSSINISSPSKGSGRLREKHVGGIVGDKAPNKATQLANKIFNAKPNETVIKSLIGELQIPPKNIAQNFIPAMQNFANQVSSMVSGRNTTPAVVSQDTHYNFGDVTVKADNPMQLFRGLDNIINARKK
ncbi:hypothetical protein [Brevibacillus sp. NRS-1366]|uniref:hypothetical protein n=1 Tax=Brevibacillus sp. NRS-1366 TaxID=3233899 RepID=UPI003D21BA32